MATTKDLRDYRPAIWMCGRRRSNPALPGRRLRVYVAMTDAEMAAALSMTVQQARAIRRRDQMYFALRPHRWLGPN